MSTSLTYCYLANKIQKWPGLLLSLLSGEEVMPLDYRAGDSGWLLYARGLNKQRISQFQQPSGNAIVIVSSCRIDDYQVVRVPGSLSAKIKKIAEECGLDVLPLGIAKRLNFDDIIYMSYSIDFRRKVIFTMEEEGLSIAKRLNFDYKIYVFLQYKFTDIE